MKLRFFLIYTVLISCYSCIPELEDGAYVGVGIDIVNVTNTEFENVKLHVGGIKDDKFISTDFYELPTIIVRPNESFSQVVTIDETRWKTDLNKIYEISSDAYFAIEFEDDNIILVEDYNKGGLVYFSTKKNNLIKKKYGGTLNIHIDEKSIVTGRFFEDTMFR